MGGVDVRRGKLIVIGMYRFYRVGKKALQWVQCSACREVNFLGGRDRACKCCGSSLLAAIAVLIDRVYIYIVLLIQFLLLHPLKTGHAMAVGMCRRLVLVSTVPINQSKPAPESHKPPTGTRARRS